MGQTKYKHQLTRREKQNIQGRTKLRSSSWWEKEVKGEKPLTLCTRCHAVYFDEHWHAGKGLYEASKGRKSVREVLCPECLNITINKGGDGYEGEVVLKGLDDLEQRGEVIREVRNIGRRAARRDPEDQIIKIEDRGSTIRVTTTENQLAVSIGKQVDRAHKGGKLEIKWSKEDMVARVVWIAPTKVR